MTRFMFSSSPDRRCAATPISRRVAGADRAPRCPCSGHRRRCAAALAPAQARPGRGPRRCLQDDGAVEREISRARVAVMEAALGSLDGDRSRAATMMREQYAAARKVAEDPYEPQAATKYDELRLRAIAAQREALYHLRAQGEIGDEAFRRIQEELDWSELDAAPAGSFQSLTS